MPRKPLGLFQGMISLLLLILSLWTCKGATGPPGLLPPGKVQGRITVWEDLNSNSRNNPTAISAGQVTVALQGDSIFTTETTPSGDYILEEVPAGNYTVIVAKDSAAATGYGTMRRFNFVVGGGTSFHSTGLGRKTQPPFNVSAQPDTLTDDSGSEVAGVLVSWAPNPVVPQFPDYQYLITFQSQTLLASIPPVVGDSVFVFGIPPGIYNVFVQADLGFSYVDARTGEVVTPTLSTASVADQLVAVTRALPVTTKPQMPASVNAVDLRETLNRQIQGFP